MHSSPLTPWSLPPLVQITPIHRTAHLLRAKPWAGTGLKQAKETGFWLSGGHGPGKKRTEMYSRYHWSNGYGSHWKSYQGITSPKAADPEEHFCQVISLKISRSRSFLEVRSRSKSREVERLFHSRSDISTTCPKQDLQTSEAMFLLQGPAPTLAALPGPGEGPWTKGSEPTGWPAANGVSLVSCWKQNWREHGCIVRVSTRTV